MLLCHYNSANLTITYEYVQGHIYHSETLIPLLPFSYFLEIMGSARMRGYLYGPTSEMDETGHRLG